MKSIIIGVIMILLVSSTFGISIIDKKKSNLDMDIAIQDGFAFVIGDNTGSLGAPEVDVEIRGERRDLFFDISLDLSQLIENDGSQVLRDASIALQFPGELLLRFGQCKVPFGCEQTLSKKNRPYKGHPVSSDSITPGYDRGVAIETGTIFSLFSIQAGIFNGLGIQYDTSTLNNVLGAGKAVCSIPMGKEAKIDLVYSGLADLSFASGMAYNLGQGFAVQAVVPLGADMRITGLCEFLERYSSSFAVNNHPYWTHGIFAAAALRAGIVEPVITFDYYKSNTDYNLIDDQMTASGGLNVHVNKGLIFRLFYEWDYQYAIEYMSHTVELSMLSRI